jgi:hypothetical protein
MRQNLIIFKNSLLSTDSCTVNYTDKRTRHQKPARRIKHLRMTLNGASVVKMMDLILTNVRVQQSSCYGAQTRSSKTLNVTNLCKS